MPGDPAELAVAARDGDGKAFEALVRATYADSYTLAYRLVGNEEDARDVVQEAYLRAYKGVRRFRGDSQFSTWMYRIVANCAADGLRKRRRHRHEELSDHEAPADEHADSDPQLMAEASLLHGRVAAALHQLPPRLRSVVVLRDVYNLPNEAIASELGISETAAKVRLHRARRKLRQQLFPAPGEEEAHAI